MKKYDKYKTSGIQWIGQIPEGWEVCKFKHFANQITTPSKDSNKIGLENIESATGRFVKTNSEFDGNGIHFLQNDIVYGKLRPYLKKVWMAEFEGNAVGDFFVYRCKDNSFPNFVKYLMLSEGFTDVANGSTTGAKMPRVSSSFISNLSCALPSPDEQRDIAAYLDDKTGKIDKATEAINKQIDDLRAYRQSLISETVTKGLNPDAPMKDSGIQWIGQIPKHWDCFKLRNLTSKIGSGSTPRGGAAVYTDSGVKFLRSQNIYNDGLKLTDVAHINEDTHQKMSNTHVLVGDVLYNITGGSIGRCCIAPDSLGEANVNQHVSIIRANELIENVFLLYCLQSIYGQSQTKVLQSGSNREGLSASAFGNFSILVPPLSEQRDIATYLDEKTAKIDEAIKALETQRDDLALLKNSLISEAVTGKVDVRGWNNNHETRN